MSIAEFLVRSVHSFADMTLVTSPQLKEEVEAIGIERVDVWQKGINVEVIENCVLKSIRVLF